MSEWPDLSVPWKKVFPLFIKCSGIEDSPSLIKERTSLDHRQYKHSTNILKASSSDHFLARKNRRRLMSGCEKFPNIPSHSSLSADFWLLFCVPFSIPSIPIEGSDSVTCNVCPSGSKDRFSNFGSENRFPSRLFLLMSNRISKVKICARTWNLDIFSEKIHYFFGASRFF